MARPFPGPSEVLRVLAAEPRGLDVAEITHRLELGGASRRRMKDLLGQLESEGKLRAQGPLYRVAAAGRDFGSWEGLLSVHPRGFAFVNSAGQDDVFIPPNAIGAALHGDTVRVTVVARTARGPEGRVDGVVKRRNARVSGVLRKRRKSCWLEPDDERIRGPIVITSFAGSSEQKFALEDGEAALVNITRFPESAQENPEGELVSVLGTPGEASVEIAKILMRDNIREERDPATLSEAKARTAELTPLSLEGRTDLREHPFLTIDPSDARDHDDAVYVEKRATGYRAFVAIADVSEYVQDGSALDKDASERCFTTYLPDRAVPMLPSVLAADQCSLLAGQDRYSLCAIVDMDTSGTFLRFRLVEAVIHVAALVTYDDVACVLGFIEGEAKSPEAAKHKRQLRIVNELAKKLRKARLQRGALDLDLPEPKVVLDPETKRPVSVTKRTKNPGIQGAYQMVEELMLLANERVARWLTGKKAPAVFRVHAPPDPQKLEQLGLVAQKLGVPFEADTLDSALGVSRWLKRLAKHPLQTVLEGLLLRSLKQAQYDTNNIGHFGLASECYVHFTSPIRRYPDLLVHRISKRLLREKAPRSTPEQIDALRLQTTRSSDIERVVMQAEREVVDVYRCLLMQDKVGEIYEARVSGLAGSGFYAQIDDPFVDVLVRFESMGPDRYEASEDGMSVYGQRSGDRISLGDRFTLVIEDASLIRRTIYGRRIPPDRVLAAADDFHEAPTALLSKQAPRRSARARVEAPGRRAPARAGESAAPPARPSRSGAGQRGRSRGKPARFDGGQEAVVGQEQPSRFGKRSRRRR